MRCHETTPPAAVPHRINAGTFSCDFEFVIGLLAEKILCKPVCKLLLKAAAILPQLPNAHAPIAGSL